MSLAVIAVGGAALLSYVVAQAVDAAIASYRNVGPDWPVAEPVGAREALEGSRSGLVGAIITGLINWALTWPRPPRPKE